MAGLIASPSAFAKDKAKGHKHVKPVAVVVQAPSAAPRVKPRNSSNHPTTQPAARPARSTAPPKSPWVGHTVTIAPSERHVIRAYVLDRVQASKGGKFNGVPQGLAKKVAWGNTLPPGWEKRCVPGKVLPAEVHKHCQPLPHAIVVKLPPPPPGTVLLAVDGKVLRVGYPTYEILDVFGVL